MRFITAILLGCISFLHAQSINPTELLIGSQQDANHLGGLYLEPVGIGMVSGINQGYLQSARPLAYGEFSLMLTPTVIFVPEKSRTFLIRNSDLQTIELASQGITQAEAPTAVGASEEGPYLKPKDGSASQSVRTPAGADFNIIPVGIINIAGGVGYGTSVSIRFLPKMPVAGLNDGRIGMYGLSVMHNLSQHFSKPRNPLQFAAYTGFSGSNLKIPLQTGPGHEVVISASSFIIGVTTSYDIEFFTPYASLSYNTGRVQMNVNGTFTYDPYAGSTADDVILEDPVSAQTTKGRGLRATAGFRLQFAEAVNFSLDYSLGHFSALTVGLGFQFGT